MITSMLVFMFFPARIQATAMIRAVPALVLVAVANVTVLMFMSVGMRHFVVARVGMVVFPVMIAVAGDRDLCFSPTTFTDNQP